MHLTIVSPTSVIYENKASVVIFPGKSGQFTVLENHSVLIAELTEGIIRVCDVNKIAPPSYNWFIKKGVVDVRGDNNIVVMVDWAVGLHDCSSKVIEDNLQKWYNKLEQATCALVKITCQEEIKKYKRVKQFLF